MTTIIKFKWCLKCESYHPLSYPDKLDHEELSGEYIPLAEYQALKAHMESLAKETYELKGLLRRVNEIGPSLTDSLRWSIKLLGATEGYGSPELERLIEDIQEAL